MVTVQEIREQKLAELAQHQEAIERFRQTDPEVAGILDTLLGSAAVGAAGALAGPALGAAGAAVGGAAGRLRGSISSQLRKSVRTHAAKGTLIAKPSGTQGIDFSAGAPGVTKGVGRFGGIEPGRFGKLPSNIGAETVAATRRTASFLGRAGAAGSAAFKVGGVALFLAFILEEASQRFDFAVKSAIDAGDTQLATEIIDAQEQLLQSIPVKLASAIPGFGSFFEAAKKGIESARALVDAPGKVFGRTAAQSFEAGQQFELGQQSAQQGARLSDIEQEKENIALKLGFEPGKVVPGGVHEGVFRKALHDSGLKAKFEALELEESKATRPELHRDELAPEGTFTLRELKKLREGVTGGPRGLQTDVGLRTPEQIRKGAGTFTPAPVPKKKPQGGGGGAAATQSTQTAGFTDIRGATGSAPIGPKKRLK